MIFYFIRKDDMKTGLILPCYEDILICLEITLLSSILFDETLISEEDILESDRCII